MNKVMIRMSVLFIVAMSVAPQLKAQAFKAALFHEEYGTVRVVAQKDGYSFDLLYQVPEEKYVKVNIINQDDRVVFTESFRGRDTFRRPYNLSKLPKGEYLFEVTGRLGTYTQVVRLD
ncbi:MAG: hypothetical protein AAFQ98_24470 [Bacteroidota bacterium]